MVLGRSLVNDKNDFNLPIPWYSSFQRLEIDVECVASEVALKANFKLLFYDKRFQSISSLVGMRDFLYSLKPILSLYSMVKTCNRFQAILMQEFVP